MKKILVSGSTGFIGAKTVYRLQEEGYRLHIFKGDVRSKRDWADNLEGRETVVHIAGIRTETETDFEVNTQGTHNLFIAARQSNKIPQKVIIVSSQAIYYGLTPPFKESMVISPSTFYGQSKHEAEKVAQKESVELGISLVILRYSPVLGPGIRRESHMSGPLVTWIEAGLQGKPIIVFNNGKQTRDYIHVEDVVSANVIAVTKIKNGVFNVGGGKKIPLHDLALVVKKMTGEKSKIIFKTTKASLKEPKDLFSDTQKLRKFGWKPAKSIKDAVSEFVEQSRD